MTILSAYAPIPYRKNRKPARCARCHKPLAAGCGQAWQMLEQIPSNKRAYLCPGCSVSQATEELALLAAREALDVMGLALGWGRPLGFVDEQRVRAAVRKAGARGALGAKEAAQRLGRGELLSVWDVIKLIGND